MTAAKLLVVDARHGLRHIARHALVDVLQRGDLVVANDAATLPASLHGTHVPRGQPPSREGGPIEVRLAGRTSLSFDVVDFSAVVFGAGDFHTRTEDRPLPPPLAVDDTLELGPLSATITALLGHPRLVSLRFHGSPDRDLGRSRAPRQAHPVLACADAARPVGCLDGDCEPARRVRTALGGLRPRLAHNRRDARARYRIRHHHACRRHFVDGRSGAGQAASLRRTVRHTGSHRTRHISNSLNRRPHRCRRDNRRARSRARNHEGTKTRRHEERIGEERPLEDVVHAGPGIATQRIGPSTRIRVVDAILTGVHERGTSHYELLRAFVDDLTLSAADEEMAARGYRPHEFGDSVLVIPADPMSRAAEM